MTNCDTLYKINERLDSNITRIKKGFSEHDQQTTDRFIEWRKAEGTSASRIIRCLLYARDLHDLLKTDFDSATRESMIRVMAQAEQKGWSDWTMHGFRAFSKMFYKWLRQSETYPQEISWIKTGIAKNKKKIPSILSEEEINGMIQACGGTRDKAFVSALYDSGCRIGEFLPLQRQDVSFDQYGAILNVHGKTGGRRVRVVLSAPYLASWLDALSDKRVDAPIWQKTNGKRIGAGCASKILRVVAKRAGVNKRIYPHLFRHTRASHLAPNVSTEVLREHFGWATSEMCQVYCHIAGTRTDNAILKASGIQAEANGHAAIMPVVNCPRCKEKNGAASEYCFRCGAPMNEKIAMESDLTEHKREDLLEQILSHPMLSAIIEDIKSRKQQARALPAK